MKEYYLQCSQVQRKVFMFILQWYKIDYLFKKYNYSYKFLKLHYFWYKRKIKVISTNSLEKYIQYFEKSSFEKKAYRNGIF